MYAQINSIRNPVIITICRRWFLRDRGTAGRYSIVSSLALPSVLFETLDRNSNGTFHTRLLCGFLLIMSFSCERNSDGRNDKQTIDVCISCS